MSTPSEPTPRPTAADSPVANTPPHPGDGSDDAPSSMPGGVVDRRLGLDRRAINEHNRRAGDRPERRNADDVDDDASWTDDFDRRRGPGRRLSDFTKSAEEGEMSKEQFMFLMAIDAFKKANNKSFPTWSDVLEVVRLLGYRKTMSAEITVPNAEDWREPPNAPSNVRPDRWEERAA